jgi:parallel beta-helix repeat protein
MQITNSLDFTISNNQVHNNAGYGINTNASMNGKITQNYAFENSYDGIGLGFGSVNCTVVGNNVTDNGFFGVWVDSGSEGNHIYDNNIISNSKQASVILENDWNNGAREGNYWSDYVGVDQNHDGIGDAPYAIDQNHTDKYPLMGPLLIYNTSKGFDVTVVSNSSIVFFAFYHSNSSIKMRVVNKTDSQTGGFCRIRIPHGLMTGLINVTVDGAEPAYLDHNLYDDGNDRWIYFSYLHSEREILVQGNPPPNGGLEEPFPYWILIAVAITVAAIIIASVYVLRRSRGRSKSKSRA